MTERRGFAALSLERRQAIASQGGQASQASGTGHRFDVEEARIAGRIGGQAPRRGRVDGCWPIEEYDRLLDRKKEELQAAWATVKRIERTIVAIEQAKASLYGEDVRQVR